MITCWKHSDDADGAMESDLSGAESGTRVPNEPEPRMSTADAARYCGFRSSCGLLSAFRRGKVVPVGRPGKPASDARAKEERPAP
jgi:hypothetical protein